MLFNIIDIAIISIILCSAVISLLRGFVKEVLTVIIWGLALVCGYYFGATAGNALGFITIDTIRNIVGGVLVFISIIIVGNIFGFFINKIIKVSGLGIFDRFVGLFFGVARGAVVVGIAAVMIMGSTFKDNEHIEKSSLVPYVVDANEYVSSHVPDSWKEELNEVLTKLTL